MSLDGEIAALHARIAALEARERVQHATIVASLARERVSVSARQAAEATAAASVAAAELRAVQAEVAAEAAEARAVAAEAQVASLQRRLAAARRADTHTAAGLPLGAAATTPARLAPVRGVAVAPAEPAIVAHWIATAGPRVRQLGAGITRERLSGDDTLELRAVVGELLAAAQGTAARAAAHDRAITLLQQITRIP